MENFKEIKKSNWEKIKDETKSKVILYSTFFVITLSVVINVIKNYNSFNKKDFIEYVEKNYHLNKTEELQSKINYLYEEFPNAPIWTIIIADKEAKDKYFNKLEISGFEERGIDNKILQELWSEKYYPKGSINEQLKEVICDDTHQKSEYADGENAASVGTIENDVIIFHKTNKNKYSGHASKIDEIESADWYFSHELGHVNDWNGKNNLELDKRIEFFYEITKTYSKEGSFKDFLGYLDNINQKDKKLEKYSKVEEYWATLCEYYLTFPEAFDLKASTEEKDLIKKWFISNDTNFDSSKKEKERKELIRNYYNN